jgi:hypothetical protein
MDNALLNTCDKCEATCKEIYEDSEGNYECLSCHTNYPEEENDGEV